MLSWAGQPWGVGTKDHWRLQKCHGQEGKRVAGLERLSQGKAHPIYQPLAFVKPVF